MTHRYTKFGSNRFSDSEKILWTNIDILKFCCNLDLKHTNPISPVVKLVSCFVLSHLDYCNSLLADLPTESINKLQNVQNCAGCLDLSMKKREHITPVLKNLHWLPISQ